MDFGDVIVHVFRTDVRSYYGLEKLWADARTVRIPKSEESAAVMALPGAKLRVPRVREQR